MYEVEEFLNKLLKEKDCIVVGISGGPDSMCLLSILLKFKESKKLTIICTHINHGLRKESEEEATFVKKICEENNCIFEQKNIKLLTKNIENCARIKRYEFFEQIIDKYQANYLMTAHHGDDLMETILMRLSRGSSIEGYSGFKKITIKDNYQLVRPLIFVTKDEIEKYNKNNNVEYRLDKSNESDEYTRNRYRHNILPFLKEENKNVHRKFLKFSEELNEINEYFVKITATALTEVYDFDKVNLHKFNELDLILQKRVIEYILKKEYQDNINLITDKHCEMILNLCTNNSPNKKINLPLKKVVIKNYNELYFQNKNIKQNEEYILEDCIQLNESEKICKLSDTEIKKSNYIIRLNSKEIALPLKVRTRKIGDKIKIKNMVSEKKLKDIFINEKIPLEKRDSWPIVTDANDQIIWIPGLKKSNFDKNYNEGYDIIYKYVMSEAKKNEKK